ncbi:HAMP domain-containing sensor histidine kinase [Streptomyces sp. NBC_00435]|uniref:sensor histidine kinase n=1 Tax=Streptomyces sp. NBC_00435 TaxID=2903649 RepID=UPI003FA6D4C1
MADARGGRRSRMAAGALLFVLERAQRGRESISQEVPDGWICLQPVVLPGDEVAVIENFVPEAELTRGVKESWAVMAFLAVGLIAGSVLVTDRLGSKVVRSSRRLAQASRALGQGDLDTRVEPMGPTELRDAGVAFNAMAHRMTELLAVERELVADQGRSCCLDLTQEPTAVALSDDDVAAVVDALIGNVFRHTPAGAPFGIRVMRTAQAVELVVEDGGPGIPDPDRAPSRGSSTGSTGLGLDIAQRAASATGGTMRITRGPLGGAHITVTFTLAPPAPSGHRSRISRHRGR